MKNLPIKRSLCLLLMALLLSAYYSCQSDDAITLNEQTIAKENSSIISFEEFKKDHAAYAAYRKNTAGNTARMVYNAEYKFTVDTDQIIRTIRGGYTYYMFCSIPRYRERAYRTPVPAPTVGRYLYYFFGAVPVKPERH